MRGVLCGVLLAAVLSASCGSKSPEAETVPASSFDEKAAGDAAPPEKAAQEEAAPVVALPEIEAIDEDAIGVPPPSEPVGEPIEFEAKPPPVGTVRVRSWREEQAYGIKPEGTRQKTTRLVQLVEEVTAVEGERIAELKVEVRKAEEALEFADGTTNRMPLLRGTYIVKAKEGGGIDVRHASGRQVGSREVEELSHAVAAEFDEPWLNRFLGSRGLRRGETKKLSEEEKREMAAGDPVPAPIYLSLLDATDTSATFQMNYQAKNVGMYESIRTQQTVTVRRSDGQFVESKSVTARREPGGERSLLKGRVKVTYR